MKRILSLIAVLFSTLIFAQTTVTGTVTDDNNDPIPGANIVFNEMNGTIADFDGNFSISVNQNPPFTLTVSSVGFDSTTLNVTASNVNFAVELVSSQNLLDEIVVSASRVPERLFESAVTIEKFDYKDIIQSTGPDFYSSLDGLKGVQINSGGLLLQQVNTRGFSTVYNEGFVQLVDGMNNEAPGLNFSAGNLLGINELDIQSVELMPGAASALYGANATKGILFMNSKNPFDFPGISVSYKHGITSQKAAGDNYYHDIAFRAAHKFSDKFAAKVTVSYVEGEDWHAVDYRDINKLDGAYAANNSEKQDPRSFADYDGVNVYGNIAQNINLDLAFAGIVIPGLVQSGLITPAEGGAYANIFLNTTFFGTKTIRATGYNEVDLTDNKASSMKTDIALHYKPTEDSELIINSKIGQGNTMLHATNRNMLKNFSLQQHKIEYNNRNLTLRAYATIEDSGNTHDMEALGTVMVLSQPGGAAAWYGGYLGQYFGLSGIYGLINPNPLVGFGTIIAYAAGGATWDQLLAANATNDLSAHAAARKAADANMIKKGSAAWDKVYKQAITNGIDVFRGGAGILDTSKSNSFEVNYNLQDLVSIADVIVGGSFREYILRSNGTLFTDYTAPIEYTDMGLYAQAKKDFFDGTLKLTASMRYDKSQYFDGHITPRIGGVVSLTENQNIRFSYQTGYRNPSSQDQYIGLDIGSALLMGSSSDNINRFRMEVQGVSSTARYILTGKHIMENSWTLASVQAGAPVKAILGNVEPQYVKSYDLGYRINGKKTALDINAYFTEWDNFIAAQTVVTPMYMVAGGLLALSQGDFRAVSVDSNTDEVVRTYGVSAGFETELFKNYDLSITGSYNKMKFKDPLSTYEAGFNTPQTRVNVTLGSTKLAKNFSFNVTAKYHDSFMWQQSGFIDAVIPHCTVFDAAMNFDIPKINSRIKVGGANIGGNEYQIMPGSGFIGSQYYVGFTLNP
ncbi:uncharacterized protein METZ01_LOCUS7999 [marine metagenome]|uniref:TonB-dependent receptor plug domain-containing protein n=1 Tax=marine metagenome TaxID=408172 RepID=A0A381NKQ8_9ZZZZ